jgi:hypothetical protein
MGQKARKTASCRANDGAGQEWRGSGRESLVAAGRLFVGCPFGFNKGLITCPPKGFWRKKIIPIVSIACCHGKRKGRGFLRGLSVSGLRFDQSLIEKRV